VVRHPLAGGRPPIYAVDVSVWSRCDAETSPERGFYYHPSRHSAGQPIVAGWAYQWIAQIGFARESWVAPVDAKRVRPAQNANEVAAGQVVALLDRLPEREGVPLFVFDAGYDPVQLQQGLAGRRAAILVRLRTGRCFYADPVGPPARTGPPAVTARSWTPRTPRRDQRPPPSTAARTPVTARCACVPGRGCIPKPKTTRRAGPVALATSCAAPWSWWR
jgi:hypothetical protein